MPLPGPPQYCNGPMAAAGLDPAEPTTEQLDAVEPNGKRSPGPPQGSVLPWGGPGLRRDSKCWIVIC